MPFSLIQMARADSVLIENGVRFVTHSPFHLNWLTRRIPIYGVAPKKSTKILLAISEYRYLLNHSELLFYRWWMDGIAQVLLLLSEIYQQPRDSPDYKAANSEAVQNIRDELERISASMISWECQTRSLLSRNRKPCDNPLDDNDVILIIVDWLYRIIIAVL